MPLQNRVNPFGELIAVPSRGTLFGNRGGRFHTDAKTLTSRRWTSRHWICCVLDFKGRQRDVWGRYYTELFFLDEPTAFAAGHRPCFECRRQDAQAFAEFWRQAKKLGKRPGVDDMDDVLHGERLDGKAKRVHQRAIDELPDGAFMTRDGEAFAVRGDALLRWTPSGYAIPQPRPRGIIVDVLSPPSTVSVLSAGYQPRWHTSAEKKPVNHA
jgi:hypothetical protein